MSRPRKVTREQKYEWMRARQQAKIATPSMVSTSRQRQNTDEPVVAEVGEDTGQPFLVTPNAVQSDTFNEKHWKYQEAADHLAISKGTLKRLTMIELAGGATDIGTARIGPKKAHTLYTFTDSALRRIHNRMVGGYYGRPAILAAS